MSLILHIDTALEKAFVGIAKDGELIMSLENDEQKDHASFVQPAIEELFRKSKLSMIDLKALGVTEGPGSYTGLRVGMASAKGICFALNIPLITVGTLQVMTAAAIENFPGFDLYCPMIDARRNEVFTSLYNSSLEIIQNPHALILDENSFAAELGQKKSIAFFGSGAGKWQKLLMRAESGVFLSVAYSGKHLSTEIYKKYDENQFSDLAYAEPLYVKEFHSTTPKPNP